MSSHILASVLEDISATAFVTWKALEQQNAKNENDDGFTYCLRSSAARSLTSWLLFRRPIKMESKALSCGGVAADAILERGRGSRKVSRLGYSLDTDKFRVCPCLIWRVPASGCGNARTHVHATTTWAKLSSSHLNGSRSSAESPFACWA